MANKLYNQLAGQQQDPTGGFRQFMEAHRGQNANDILQQIVSSGKISQSQLDQAQKMAGHMGKMLNGMRSMFGFN